MEDTWERHHRFWSRCIPRSIVAKREARAKGVAPQAATVTEHQRQEIFLNSSSFISVKLWLWLTLPFLTPRSPQITVLTQIGKKQSLIWIWARPSFRSGKIMLGCNLLIFIIRGPRMWQARDSLVVRMEPIQRSSPLFNSPLALPQKSQFLAPPNFNTTIIKCPHILSS